MTSNSEITMQVMMTAERARQFLPRWESDHNDICEKCSKGGELLLCEFCNVVLHLGCVDPPLTAAPEGVWSCSSCLAEAAAKEAREVLPAAAGATGGAPTQVHRKEKPGKYQVGAWARVRVDAERKNKKRLRCVGRWCRLLAALAPG